MIQISSEDVNSQQKDKDVKLNERSLLDLLKISKLKQSKKLVHKIITFAFAIQAIIIGVKGGCDILSGKPKLDVIQSTIAQGVELIIKAYNAERRLGKKRDRIKKPNE